MKTKLKICRRLYRNRYYRAKVWYKCTVPIVIELGTHPKFGGVVDVLATVGHYDGSEERPQKDLAFVCDLEVWSQDGSRIVVSGRGHSLLDECIGNGVPEAIKEPFVKLVRLYWDHPSVSKTGFQNVIKAIETLADVAVTNGGRVYTIPTQKELEYRRYWPKSELRESTRKKYVHRHLDE